MRWNGKNTYLLVLVLLGFMAIQSGFAGDRTKKVMWINSYTLEADDGAAGWAGGISKGIHSVLDPLIEGKEGIEYAEFHMDTKRKPGDAYAAEAAKKAYEAIKKEKPSIVITSDDAAAKFLVAKYLAGKKLPVVFCGINFDEKKYGLPTANVTGMVEVPPMPQMLEELKKYSIGNGGNGVAYLTYDDISEHGNLEGIKNVFGMELASEVFVDTMDEWESAYLAMQNNHEIGYIIMGSANFMPEWNWNRARKFILDNTTDALPGTYNSWTTSISLLAYSKRATEQGAYAASTAVKILLGEKIENFDVVVNTQGDLFLNGDLAEKLGIRFNSKHESEGKVLTAPWKK